MARFIAWKSGDALAMGISAATGFHVPDEPLQPFLLKLPMLLGKYEPETMAAMRDVVRPGMTVIDGGAHVGYFTTALSKMVGPKGRVLACEMNPPTLRLLRRNTRHCANVEVIPVAIGERDEMVTMYENNGLTSSASVTETKPGLHATRLVQMRSLQSVLDERKIGRADFIKLDIEGGEPAVLRSLKGPAKVLFEIKRYILEAGGEAPEALIAELRDLGFSTKIVSGSLDKANVLAVRA
jgi:FkbM family methyltransferase